MRVNRTHKIYISVSELTTKIHSDDMIQNNITYHHRMIWRYSRINNILENLGYNEFPYYELFESAKQTLIYEPL